MNIQLVDSYRRKLGDEHPDVLTRMHNLAYTHKSLGNEAAAVSQYRRVLAVRRKTLGPDDTATFKTMQNLASALGYEDESALALSQEATDGFRRVLGLKHPETLMAMGNVAVLHMNRGEHAAAAPLLEHTVEGLLAVYGEEHSSTQHWTYEKGVNVRMAAEQRSALDNDSSAEEEDDEDEEDEEEEEEEEEEDEDEDEEEEEEEETMYNRLAKRRRLCKA